uniref:Uncharacterized protein n=1 Tax=viral metagenome TaxID=1070528 RepID=A0A6M3L634_9ZZZZ
MTARELIDKLQMIPEDMRDIDVFISKYYEGEWQGAGLLYEVTIKEDRVILN